MLGKNVRLERIINRQTGNTVIVPMDHGVTVGPIPGIISVKDAAQKIAEGGADAAIVHKGAARFGHRGYGKDLGLIVHLSASTSLGPDSNRKVLVCTVEEALRMGADAVSIHVNVGAENEAEMLRALGVVACKCDYWGMPLVAMMYPRGKKVENEHGVEYVKHAARVGAELGADIIKTNYTGDPDSFKEVVRGCPVPVVVAGGPKTETEEDFFNMVRDAMDAGARGVAIGRNVFQADDPAAVTRKICEIVHGCSR